MAQPTPLTLETEVAGEILMAFAAGLPQDFRSLGLRILERHGVFDPKPRKYYPLKSLLDAMKEISDNFCQQMLFRIGEQVALNAALPRDIDSLQKCLASMDAAYRMNHRGRDIGGLEYNFIGSEEGLQRATITCRNPYPCAFERGVVQGFASRFKPPGIHEAIVRHDDSQPCRAKGNDSCTYVVSWLVEL